MRTMTAETPDDAAVQAPATDGQQDAEALAARNFAAFVGMVEDGQLNADLSDELRLIAKTLRDHVNAFGGKPKASLTVTFGFTQDDAIADIRCDFKTKLPKVNRARTVAWATPAGNFSPQNPRQMTLFGTPRSV